MIQDQLTRAERIRLESISQSIQSFFGRTCSDGDILARARIFERFLREADDDIAKEILEKSPQDHDAEHSQPGDTGGLYDPSEPRSFPNHADHEQWLREQEV